MIKSLARALAADARPRAGLAHWPSSSRAASRARAAVGQACQSLCLEARRPLAACALADPAAWLAAATDHPASRTRL